MPKRKHSWPCVDEIVDLAYAAPSELGFRQHVLRLMLEIAGADLASFVEPSSIHGDLDCLIEIPADFMAGSRAEVLRRPQEIVPLLRTLECSTVVRDFGPMSWREAERVRLYQLFFKPQGITSHVGVTLRARDPLIVMTLSRVGGRPLPEVVDTQLDRLAPVLSMASAWLASDRLPAPLPAQPRGPIRGLTSRQQEICTYLAAGCSNKEIARACGVSPYTVRNHLVAILRHAGVANRTELVSRLALSSEARGDGSEHTGHRSSAPDRTPASR